MNAFAAYRAINTKLHCKRRIMLSKEEWKTVSEYKTVSQVIEFLKKRKGYEVLFENYKLEQLNRTQLEVILDHYVVSEIETLLHYFSGHYEAFFRVFLMSYEINDLQLLLRNISRQEHIQNIESFFCHSRKYSKCHYEDLVACRSIQQFIDALKGTCYYDALKTMTSEDMAKREFHMEMKLYILFYTQLMEMAQKLEAKDYEIAHKIIGTKVDCINVEWIFRATKYYELLPEEILIYTLPFGYKLTYQKLKALCYAKNLEEFKKMSQKFLGFDLFRQADDTYVEHTIYEEINKMLSHFGGEGENIAMALIYIYSLEIQIKDIISLTEGIRYALPTSELGKYIVHTL